MSKLTVLHERITEHDSKNFTDSPYGYFHSPMEAKLYTTKLVADLRKDGFCQNGNNPLSIRNNKTKLDVLYRIEEVAFLTTY